MAFKITNKIKKHFGGNWGHPRRETKKRTEIPQDFFDDKEPKHHAKKKRVKKVWNFEWTICPFCKEKLDKKKSPPDLLGGFLERCVDECKCGAKGDHPCPSCKRNTWYKDGIYKHQWMGCGFEGAKKYAVQRPNKT